MAGSLETLPPISSLASSSRATQEAVLSLLFEPSPALHEVAVPLLAENSYGTYADMIDSVGDALQGLDTNGDLSKLEEILSSHPRLGEKKVESALSRAEQAAMVNAGSIQATEDVEKEAEILRQLNKQYEEQFPGLRYVVFVNGRSRLVIFENMQTRIQRADIKAERQEAIKAMCDIAKDRANKLQQ